MSDVNADKIPVPAQPEVLLHCLMDIAEALLACLLYTSDAADDV